ncbi:MAG: phosphate signaling complex protein PhoU [Fimbriimonas sp.]|nr:phosphate signaling complex protein PhoU [Fimbriimonas sp.]
MVESPSYARQAYYDEIRELEHDVLDMGSRAEQMVGQAVDAICSLDVQLAMHVILKDDEIDERDLQIETRCLRLLALQQPMASDLRVVGTAMKMITDIERVGDLAVDIAKIALKIEKEFGETNFIDIPKMAKEARSMLHEALEAYVQRDLNRVQEVCDKDEIVDALYRELRTQIFTDMQTNPEQVVADGWLLLAIHHVERIADHAVNIAERVNFMVTGELRSFTKKDPSQQT